MLTQVEKDLVDDHFQSVFAKIIVTVNSRKGDVVSRALMFFLVRVTNTWLSLRTLSNHVPDQECFMVDAGVLLRCMFDAYLQAEHVLFDPAKRVERATAYFDFEHVDRHEHKERMLKLPGWLGDRFRSSALRAEGEPWHEKEYQRVRPLFLKSDGKGTRDKWYKANLGNLASDVKKQHEYDLYLFPAHGCVHSSAFAVRQPLVPPALVMELATTLTARVAQMNVDYNKLTLSDEESENLSAACKGYF